MVSPLPRKLPAKPRGRHPIPGKTLGAGYDLDYDLGYDQGYDLGYD